MYLSRWHLDTTSPYVRDLIARRQQLHATVCATAGEPIISDTGRLLWRLDTKAGRSPQLLMLSPKPPAEPERLDRCSLKDHPSDTAEYDRLVTKLVPGALFAFRLTANPVQAVPRTTKPAGPSGRVRSKRLGCSDLPRQMQWLQTRAGAHGFELASRSDQILTQVTNSEWLEFRRQGLQCTLISVTYEGILRVQHPQALWDTMINGLGRGRAYGCGLLTLTRAVSIN